MATIVKTGESIEGLKIKGKSRKPLELKNIVHIVGVKCFRFLARFNTKSSLIEEITRDTKKIFKDSKTNVNDEIICDDAVIHSIHKKHSTYSESNASGTHGAFCWSFPRQTNAKIIKSHEEIENAIKRKKLNI